MLDTIIYPLLKYLSFAVLAYNCASFSAQTAFSIKKKLFNRCITAVRNSIYHMSAVIADMLRSLFTANKALIEVKPYVQDDQNND